MMRNQITLTAISIILAAISFSSCKKDNNSTPDYSAAFTNTVWTGELNYSGKAAEPFSMSFAAGGAVSLYELKGEYNGTWKLENGLLVISIGGSISFTADVSGGNQLTNIKSTDLGGRILNNAALNPNPDEVLDNTIWIAQSLVLQFKAGAKLDITIATSQFSNLSYTRKGKSIRFSVDPNYRWFMVNNSQSTMKGANSYSPSPTVYPFALTLK